ncbi:MAG TPA: GH25 family lysozyme, partial [Ilumatobacteraceae bacterium]|nr:GH25 family lysozyme [Ilumatobacteraceae bacterium]
MIPIIDVSKWQGDIDFTRAARNGVRGVVVRAGNGTAADARCGEYIAGARKAGLVVGVYWFCNPKRSSGADQGQRLADAHNLHRCELPPMLDVEDYTGEPGTLPVLSPAQFTTWLTAMRVKIESAVGRAGRAHGHDGAAG